MLVFFYRFIHIELECMKIVVGRSNNGYLHYITHVNVVITWSRVAVRVSFIELNNSPYEPILDSTEYRFCPISSAFTITELHACHENEI